MWEQILLPLLIWMTLITNGEGQQSKARRSSIQILEENSNPSIGILDLDTPMVVLPLTQTDQRAKILERNSPVNSGIKLVGWAGPGNLEDNMSAPPPPNLPRYVPDFQPVEEKHWETIVEVLDQTRKQQAETRLLLPTEETILAITQQYDVLLPIPSSDMGNVFNNKTQNLENRNDAAQDTSKSLILPDKFNPFTLFLPDHIPKDNNHLILANKRRFMEEANERIKNSQKEVKYVQWPHTGQENTNYSPIESIVNTWNDIRKLSQKSDNSHNKNIYERNDWHNSLSNGKRVQIRPWPDLTVAASSPSQDTSPTEETPGLSKIRVNSFSTLNTAKPFQKNLWNVIPKKKQWPSLIQDSTSSLGNNQNVFETNPQLASVSKSQSPLTITRNQIKLTPPTMPSRFKKLTPPPVTSPLNKLKAPSIVNNTKITNTENKPINNNTKVINLSPTTQLQISKTILPPTTKQASGFLGGDKVYNQPWLHGAVQHDLKEWGYPYDKNAPLNPYREKENPIDQKELLDNLTKTLYRTKSEQERPVPTDIIKQEKHLAIIEVPQGPNNGPLPIKNVHVIAPKPDNIPPVPIFRPAEKKPLDSKPYFLRGIESRSPGSKEEDPMLIVPYPSGFLEYNNSGIYPVIVPLSPAADRQGGNSAFETLMKPLRSIFPFRTESRNNNRIRPNSLRQPPSRNIASEMKPPPLVFKRPEFGPPKGDDILFVTGEDQDKNEIENASIQINEDSPQLLQQQKDDNSNHQNLSSISTQSQPGEVFNFDIPKEQSIIEQSQINTQAQNEIIIQHEELPLPQQQIQPLPLQQTQEPQIQQVLSPQFQKVESLQVQSHQIQPDESPQIQQVQSPQFQQVQPLQFRQVQPQQFQQVQSPQFQQVQSPPQIQALPGNTPQTFNIQSQSNGILPPVLNTVQNDAFTTTSRPPFIPWPNTDSSTHVSALANTPNNNQRPSFSLFNQRPTLPSFRLPSLPDMQFLNPFNVFRSRENTDSNAGFSWLPSFLSKTDTDSKSRYNGGNNNPTRLLSPTPNSHFRSGSKSPLFKGQSSLFDKNTRFLRNIPPKGKENALKFNPQLPPIFSKSPRLQNSHSQSLRTVPYYSLSKPLVQLSSGIHKIQHTDNGKEIQMHNPVIQNSAESQAGETLFIVSSNKLNGNSHSSSIVNPQTNPARSSALFANTNANENLGPELIKFTLADAMKSSGPLRQNNQQTRQLHRTAMDVSIQSFQNGDMDLASSEDMSTVAPVPKPVTTMSPNTLKTVQKSNTIQTLKPTTQITNFPHIKTVFKKSRKVLTPTPPPTTMSAKPKPVQVSQPPEMKPNFKIPRTSMSRFLTEKNKFGTPMTTIKPTSYFSSGFPSSFKSFGLPFGDVPKANSPFSNLNWGFTQPADESQNKMPDTLGRSNNQDMSSSASSRITIIEATPMPKAGEIFPTVKDFQTYSSATLKTPTTHSESSIKISSKPTQSNARENVHVNSKELLFLPLSAKLQEKEQVLMPGSSNHRSMINLPKIESDLEINPQSENTNTKTKIDYKIRYNAPPRKVFHAHRATPKPALVTETFPTLGIQTTTERFVVTPSPVSIETEVLTGQSSTTEASVKRHPTSHHNTKHNEKEESSTETEAPPSQQDREKQKELVTTERSRPRPPLAGRPSRYNSLMRLREFMERKRKLANAPSTKKTSISTSKPNTSHMPQQISKPQISAMATTYRPIVTTRSSTVNIPKTFASYRELNSHKTTTIDSSRSRSFSSLKQMTARPPRPRTLTSRKIMTTEPPVASRALTPHKSFTTKPQARISSPVKQSPWHIQLTTITTKTPKNSNPQISTHNSNFKQSNYEPRGSDSSFSYEYRQPIHDVNLQDHPEMFDFFNWESTRVGKAQAQTDTDIDINGEIHNEGRSMEHSLLQNSHMASDFQRPTEAASNAFSSNRRSRRAASQRRPAISRQKAIKSSLPQVRG